jgi:diadenosine tetraphosphate (Ap4A) HIT family hydrolase
VDAGQGWLIFALPATEAAFHPGEKNDAHELYFMCDDLKASMKSLQGSKVKCGPVQRGTTGQPHVHFPPRRRQDWPLPAKTPGCHWTLISCAKSRD